MVKGLLLRVLCIGLACWLAVAGAWTVLPEPDCSPVVTPFEIGGTGEPPG
jgi:hypothetical protein